MKCPDQTNNENGPGKKGPDLSFCGGLNMAEMMAKCCENMSREHGSNMKEMMKSMCCESEKDDAREAE